MGGTRKITLLRWESSMSVIANSRRIRRVCILMATVGMIVLAVGGTADASPKRTSPSDSTVGVVLVGDQRAGSAEPASLAWDVTFDRPLTAGLWNAAGISATAFVTYCVVAVPRLLRPACVYIADSSLFGQFRRMGPPNGRCLNMSPRLGIPPYGLSYVRCP
jgi:hypothetical protein